MYGTPESKDRYDEVVAAWLAGMSNDKFTLAVDELALMYVRYCESYYTQNTENRRPMLGRNAKP